MQKSQRNQTPDNSIAQLSLTELRQKWAECWGMQPHASISRGILAQSLEFRLREQKTGGLSAEQRARLEQLKKSYRRNPRYFDDASYRIKPGTRLVRTWHGTKYSVIVLESGFQHQDKVYSSLSEIASQITGTRWNGWVFFGLKKRGANETAE